jgi:hypothetical protein
MLDNIGKARQMYEYQAKRLREEEVVWAEEQPLDRLEDGIAQGGLSGCVFDYGTVLS